MRITQRKSVISTNKSLNFFGPKMPTNLTYDTSKSDLGTTIEQ